MCSNDNGKILACNFKVVLLGETSVGKTSIVTRLTTESFHTSKATIGAVFTTKTISVEDVAADGSHIQKEVHFEIWDTAGQERYRSLVPMYYRNTDAAVVVFDLTVPETLKLTESWLEELKPYMEREDGSNIIVMLVGNKMDLVEAPDTVSDTKDVFTTVSARTGEGIHALFTDIAKKIPISRFEAKSTWLASQERALELVPKTSNQPSRDSCAC